MKNFILIVSFFLLILSCDPSDEYDSVNFEPTVSFIFINQDSIVAINNYLTVIENIDDHISTNTNSLQIFRDSLQTIATIIENEGMLSQLKMTIEHLIKKKQTDSLILMMKKDQKNTLVSMLNRIKNAINSGLILVNEIAVLDTDYVETYTDSSRIWSIPLSYRGDFHQYKVTINGVTEIIELSYDRFQKLDRNRNILIRAKNIRLIEKSYTEIDSVKSNCTENCIDGETTFTFYL